MIMAARQLLSVNPNPTRAEIQEGLAGNLCRCGGYSRILDAVLLAAAPQR
jgi:carbon-monoxide dehydrogenase small subunit